MGNDGVSIWMIGPNSDEKERLNLFKFFNLNFESDRGQDIDLWHVYKRLGRLFYSRFFESDFRCDHFFVTEKLITKMIMRRYVIFDQD